MITETRAHYDGVRTRVLAVPGAGPPIVFLHGFADDADTWRGVLSRLDAAGRQAFAVDLPGFGQADRRPRGAIMPALDSFADALVAAHGPMVVVGNSLGAAVAVRAAARDRHERVRAVVTLNEPILADHWLARLARRRDHTRVMSAVAVLPLPRPALHRAVRWAVPRFLYGPGYAAEPAVLARWVSAISGPRMIGHLGADALRLAHETIDGYGPIAVDCPVLVVHGAKDRIIPVKSSRVLHALVPYSELVVLPRSGHCPQLDDPDEVTRLVLDLVASKEAI